MPDGVPDNNSPVLRKKASGHEMRRNFFHAPAHIPGRRIKAVVDPELQFQIPTGHDDVFNHGKPLVREVLLAGKAQGRPVEHDNTPVSLFFQDAQRSQKLRIAQLIRIVCRDIVKRFGAILADLIRGRIWKHHGSPFLYPVQRDRDGRQLYYTPDSTFVVSTLKPVCLLANMGF